MWGTSEPLTPWIVIQGIFYWLAMLCCLAFFLLCGYIAFEAMKYGM